MTDLLREISQTISHNKLRTALTGFAVAWGVFMLIVLLSIASGLVNGFTDKMMTRDDNVMTVWGGVTSTPWKGLKEGRVIELENSDMKAIESGSDASVVLATAKLGNDTASFSTGREVLTGGYLGVYPDAMDYDGIELTAGRFINLRDMEQKRRALVIDSREATRIFGSDSAAVGSVMNSMGLAWEIVGVYSHRWRGTSYVPFATALSLTGNSTTVGEISVELDGISSLEQGEAAEQSVKEVLSRTHSFDPGDPNAVWIWNRFSDRVSSNDMMNVLIYSMWIIGILTLLSGIVGVSNIMFVSVRERTHEIGIRRAIGAKPRTILLQIVLESVTITTLFGYIGIVLGTVLMAFLKPILTNMEMFSNPVISLSMAFEVTGVLVAAGALAGLFPALKATKVKPVEALRDE